MIPISQSSGGQASDVGRRPARNLSFSVAANEGSDDQEGDLLELNEMFTEDYYPPDLDYSMMSVLFDAFPAVTSHPQRGAGPGSRSGAGQATQSKATKRTTKTTKKRPAEDEADHEDAPTGSNPERKERNREHAKNSRERKRVLMDTLHTQLSQLRNENVSLRRTIAERIPHANEIFNTCTEPLLASSTDSKMLMEPDYRLMEALVHAQQNFLLTDPSLPDNPIVYASDGFCKLTGYKRGQILGRNCRFLQGPLTDQGAVDIIRQGVTSGRDVSVCLVNYKADGKPFWNHFFLGALKDGQGKVVNYVGVQCEVDAIPVEQLKQRVRKMPIVA